jgi:hypothetical protein
MPVPSVTRSVTTAGMVWAIGVPVTWRMKTLFKTPPSLPGETVMERPAAKMVTFFARGILTSRSLR